MKNNDEDVSLGTLFSAPTPAKDPVFQSTSFNQATLMKMDAKPDNKEETSEIKDDHSVDLNGRYLSATN